MSPSASGGEYPGYSQDYHVSQNIPDVSEQIEFDPRESNFTLLTDEQTLQEIDEIREDAIKASQAILKFAWR